MTADRMDNPSFETHPAHACNCDEVIRWATDTVLPAHEQRLTLTGRCRDRAIARRAVQIVRTKSREPPWT